jgi:hypothetical protein
MSIVELLVEKAVSRLTGHQPRGVITDFSPYAVGMRIGQVQRTIADAYGQITPQRRREIVLKSPTVAALANAVKDFCAGTEITVRNSDAAKPAPTRAAKLVRSLLDNPNQQDDSLEFRRRLYRELISFGYAAVEVEPGVDGSKVANWYVLDGANLTLDFDKHGTILGYYQRDINGDFIRGSDGNHTFTPDQVIFYQLDPRAESGYPMARVDQLFAPAVIEIMMLGFIGGRFQDSNIPFGVMDLGDLTKDEVDEAVSYWNQQVEEANHPEHRIIFTGSKGGAKWLPFGYNMDQLQASELLAAVRTMILSIWGVTANEMGEGDEINKSNGFNLSYTFKKRAIEPLLDTFVSKTTNKLVRELLGIQDIELGYEDIDSRDELLQVQVEEPLLKLGVYTINYLRNKRGQPSVPGGEKAYIFTGANVIAVDMLEQFAQAQLDALNILNLQSQVGIAQVLQQMQQPTVNPDGSVTPPPPLPPLGTLPLMRMQQPPMRFTTPDASGSSSTKFSMPKPGMKPVPPSSAPPTAPRGKAEAAQRAGARKDKMNG